jgi:large subunit ribosomal protein L46
MSTWILGNQPIGHFEQTLAEDQHKTNEDGNVQVGDLTFFMKGRIMAGQADIKESELGVKDFKWLAKEEIEKLVPEKYWSSVQSILPQR